MKIFKGLLREYRIFNADVIIREDATADQFVDELEGNRKYFLSQFNETFRAIPRFHS